MAYGIKYQAYFDNVVNTRYKVEILKKDYAGSIGTILFTGTPIKHSWQTDEPKAAIKGSSLILNAFGFEGETIVTNHSALFEIDLVSPGVYEIFINSATFIPELNVPFTVTGHSDPIANATWTPAVIVNIGGGLWGITPAEVLTSAVLSDTITITQEESTGFHLIDFYSEEDDTYKCRFYEEDQLKFEGFLVQDDCNELMADYIHEISLSFNDNLGLLKDVALDANVPDFGGWLVTAQMFASGNQILLWDSRFIPQVGVPFTITNHIDPTVNASWTPTAVNTFLNAPGSGYIVVSVASVPGDTVAYASRITGAGQMDLFARNTLLNIIAVCIYNTGLELDTFIYANVFETSDDNTDCFLAQTFIDTKTFLTGNNFDSCYDVLTKILERFNLTLFQSNGQWNIARWDEIRYGVNLPFFQYDSGFNLIGTGTMNAAFTTGFQQAIYPEVGLTRSIIRPFKYDKETFNYHQPESLIVNSNLQTLGALDHTDTDATYTYDYYEFPEVSKWVHVYSDTSLIVVKTETALNKEAERYVYQPKSGLNTGGGYLDYTNVQLNDIQVSKGDVMDFEIKIKTASSTSGDAVIYRFGFYLQETEDSYWILNNDAGAGADFRWLHLFVTPIQGIGINHTILAGEAENYYSYKLSDEGAQLRVPSFPVDAVLRIRLYGTNEPGGSQPNVDAIWKDIVLTMIQNINDSTKIIGHTHKSEQNGVIKNNENVDIFIDDAPRSTIAGTLYKAAYSGLVLLRTTEWYRLTNPSELLRIGEIMTFEQLFWRKSPRAKLEGTFYGVLNISMLAILKNVAFNELNLIFGSLEIEYKNNNFTSTMWEIFEDGEVDGDLTDNYSFDYLYDAK